MATLIGSVPYLNARPLIKWFETDEGLASGIEVIEDTPSRLARMLVEGRLDAALVSTFASFQRPDFIVLPGVSISGQGEIKSVRAFSHIPFAVIQSVAMDTSSLTSVALLKILLAEAYNAHPESINADPDLSAMLNVADAALLIGDPGMLADGRGLRVLDLGESWRRHAGLPFTYAVWLCRPDRVSGSLIEALQIAKEYGINHANSIAQEQAQKLGCSHRMCYDYITEVMDYELGDEHMEAIATFHRKCRLHGLLAQPL